MSRLTDPHELMHAVLDGEASPRERAALDALLAADPEAHARFEELEDLFAALKRAPQAPAAPAGLAERIVSRAIVKREPGPGGSGMALRYAASFGAGALLVLLGSQLADWPEPTGQDLTTLAGTMVGVPMEGPGSTSIPGLEGGLTLRRAEGLLVLAVELEGPEPLDFVLPLDGELQVVGILALGGPSPRIELGPGRLAVQQQGKQGYAVLLRGTATHVPYELYRDGRLIHSDTMGVPEPD